eukprot:1155224-Pelagomonas_calceolata.AAC.8
MTHTTAPAPYALVPSGPFRLQWTDKDGDNVTVTSRQDIQTALSELFLAFQKQHGGAHAPRLLQQNGLPPLKLQVGDAFFFKDSLPWLKLQMGALGRARRGVDGADDVRVRGWVHAYQAS